MTTTASEQEPPIWLLVDLEDEPDWSAVEKGMTSVYEDGKLLLEDERLLIISFSNAYKLIMSSKVDVLPFMKEKLKKQYEDLEKLQYPQDKLQPFAKRVLDIYVANLTKKGEEQYQYRLLPLLDRNGTEIQSRFNFALALTGKTGTSGYFQKI